MDWSVLRDWKDNEWIESYGSSLAFLFVDDSCKGQMSSTQPSNLDLASILHY